MSIFSSIKSRVGNAVKKAATYTYNTVNAVGSGLKSALNRVGGQTASALQGTYIPNSIKSGTPPKVTSSTPGGTTYYGGNQPSGAVSSGQMDSGNNFSATPVTYKSGTNNTQISSYGSGNSYQTIGGGSSSPEYYSAPAPTTVLGNKIGAESTYSSLGAVSAGGTGASGMTGAGSPAYGGTLGASGERNIALGLNPDGSAKISVDANGKPLAPNTTEQQTEKTLADYLKEQEAMAPKRVDATSLREQANQETGVRQAQEQRNTTQNAINAISTKIQTDLLGQRAMASEAGGTEFAFGGRQAQIEREGAIRLLPLQAQLAADQGNLELAKQTSDDLFKYRYQDATAKADQWYKNYEIAKENFTTSEKKKIDAIKMAHDDNKDILDKNFQLRKTIIDKALDNGQSALAQKMMSIAVPNVNDANFAQKLQQADKAFGQYAAQTGVVLEPTISGTDTPLYNGLKPATATAVRSQVSSFKTEPTVQNFAVLQEGRNFAKSLADTTKNPADDQGLIYSLAKVLDPGSVVREGEYATAQKYSQSWINAYGKGISQAIAGTGFLSETARKNIKKTIESKYKSSLTSYDNLYGQYAKGINNLTGRSDGEKFLKDYRISEDSTGSQVTDGATKEWNGVTYKVINGVWTPQ